MTQPPKKKRKSLSSCQNSPEGAKCLGKYELIQENSYPIFVCNICAQRREDWKNFYETYLALYKTKENWEEKKNWVSCILGAFCFYYQKTYTTPYVFVPRSPNPFSSKECGDAWTLIAAFAEDITEVRRYIHWLFTKKITETTALTSFGYLLAAPLIRKYKLESVRQKTLTRASPLPKAYLEWCKNTVPEVMANYTLNTMNDLGGLLSHYNAYLSGQAESVEKRAIDRARELGLVKENRLNTE